jgi:hypothetical protein
MTDTKLTEERACPDCGYRWDINDLVDPGWLCQECLTARADKVAFLRDKLKSWPGEMALTSTDIADLLRACAEYRKGEK